jgi:phosphohistidine phosphatase
MKTLLILRHAKSSWEDASLDDRERPLNKRGRRDAPRIGDLIRQQEVPPDTIVTSDALRARTTAETVAEAAAYSGKIVVDRRLYLAGPADIVDVLRTLREPEAGTVMIVGHNPGLEELVAQLTGEEQRLPTAALAQIALPIDRWSDLTTATRGTLLALWRPKELT